MSEGNNVIMNRIMKLDLKNIGYVYLINSATEGNTQMFLKNLRTKILGDRKNYDSIDNESLERLKNRVLKLNGVNTRNIILTIDRIQKSRSTVESYKDDKNANTLTWIFGFVLVFIFVVGVMYAIRTMKDNKLEMDQ